MVNTRGENTAERNKSVNSQKIHGNMTINDPLNLWPGIEDRMNILGQELVDALTRAAQYGQEDDIQDAEAAVQAGDLTRNADDPQNKTEPDDFINQDDIHGPVSRLHREMDWPGKNLDCAKEACKRGEGTKERLGCSQTEKGAKGGRLCRNWVHRDVGCAGVAASHYRLNPDLKWSCEMGEYEHDFGEADDEGEERNEKRRGKGGRGGPGQDRRTRKREDEHEGDEDEGGNEDEDDGEGDETGRPKGKPVDKGKKRAKSDNARTAREPAPSASLGSRSTTPSVTPEIIVPDTPCHVQDCKHHGEPLAHPNDASRPKLHAVQCSLVIRGQQCIHWAHRDCAILIAIKKNEPELHWRCDRHWSLMHDFGTASSADVAARKLMKRRRAGKDDSDPSSADDGGPGGVAKKADVEATTAKKPRTN